ncbi:MAG: hypothetical protein NTW33_00980 [Methanoregula sp.]|nr:hypothetical protein [Methanoregula sp.]
MKLRDLNIGTQLAIGLGIIIALVILLGVVAYVQEESLWQETKGLYEHPLQVRRAIGDLDVDILTMHVAGDKRTVRTSPPGQKSYWRPRC